MADTYYKIKESTLTEVADAIRIKTNETGLIATTEFASKIESITASEEVFTAPVVSEEMDAFDWKWCKTENGTYIDVTLPHVNEPENAQSDSFYRGDTFYKRALVLSEANGDLDYNWYLKLEQATMRAHIFVNDVEIYYHVSGYAPCTVLLTGLVDGENTIKVVCNNKNTVDAIPVSADFSYPNGIIGLAYIVKTKGVYIDPIEFGTDRVHISQRNIDLENKKANFDVDFQINNDDKVTSAKTIVDIKVLDAEDTVVLSNKDTIIINADAKFKYSKSLELNQVHLWNGRKDPYLYNIKVSLISNGTIIDTRIIPTGFRKLQATHDGGLELNGVHINLWGAACHQDTQEHFAALTHEDYENNFVFFNDIGCNYLRLAHYPHNRYEYDLADKYGYLSEVEIPWINNCPTNASQAFKDSLFQYLKDMINNLYNHACVAVWGTSNELGGDHPPVSGVGYDKDTAKVLNNELFMLGRKLDSTRYVGCQTTAAHIDVGFLGDWMAFNTYDAWYVENTTQQTTVYNKLHNDHCRYIDGISEYGGGGNILQQSENWMEEEKKGSRGKLHFESYESYIHEFQIDKLVPLMTTMGICALWVFFDFPAWPRTEGDTIGLNDKGLVLRDRSVKKDVYYLYKCFWNKFFQTGQDPIVYIKDRRISTRSTSNITITAYSNCDKVELYRNNILMQTLEAPTNTINNVIWTFNPIDFYNEEDEITVKGYRGTETEPISVDTTIFTTTGEHINSAPAVKLLEDSLTFKAADNNVSEVRLTANCDWHLVGELPEWLNITPTSGLLGSDDITVSTLQISVLDNTIEEARTITLTFSPVEENAENKTASLTILQRSAAVQAYTEVEYLESTGVQWINTNIIPKSSTITTAHMFINANQTVSNFMFGCRDDSKGSKKYEIRPAQVDFAANSITANVTNITGKDCTVAFGNNKYIVDNETPLSLSGTFESNIPMYIFGGNTSSVAGAANAANNLASMKLYYITIEDSGKVLFEGIPVLDSENKPALFDLVSEEFYYNQGTGADFLTGPVIITIPATGISYSQESITCYAAAINAQSIDVALIPAMATSNTNMTFTVSPETLGVVNYDEENSKITFTPTSAVITENIVGNIIGTLPDKTVSNLPVTVEPVPLVAATNFTLDKTELNVSKGSITPITVTFDPIIATENTQLVVTSTIGTVSYNDHIITYTAGDEIGEGTISVKLPDESVAKEISVTIAESPYLAYYDFSTKGAGSTDTTITDETGNTTATLMNMKSGDWGLAWTDTGLQNFGKDQIASGCVTISKPVQFNTTDCPNGAKIYMEFSDVAKPASGLSNQPSTNYRGRFFKFSTVNKACALDSFVIDNSPSGFTIERQTGDNSRSTAYTKDTAPSKIIFELTIPDLSGVDYTGNMIIDGTPINMGDDLYWSTKTAPVYPVVGTAYPTKFTTAAETITQFELLNRASDCKRGGNMVLNKFYIEKL